MPISTPEYYQMLARLEKKLPTPPKSASREVGRGGLHEQIERWCAAQWPRWLIIHARTDQKSTVGNGVQDFTIFCPNGRVLCIECKARGKKRTPEQNAWALQMEMLGHVVHLVYSLDAFLALTVEVRTLNILSRHGTHDQNNKAGSDVHPDNRSISAGQGNDSGGMADRSSHPSAGPR